MSLETFSENKEMIFIIKNNQEITIKELKNTLNLGKKAKFISNKKHIEISTQDINDICKLSMTKYIIINNKKYRLYDNIDSFNFCNNILLFQSGEPASWN
jgi:hypothetical protein